MRIKQEDAKKFKRILAIGDIHGEFKKLVNLWNQIHFNPKEDLVIFLGDYTDRGPDSVKCTRFIREVAKIDNVITLMGNHEQMMLYYLENNSLDDIINHPERLDNWLLNGGNVTINDFKDKGINEIYEWFHFVNTMPIFVDI
jgi:serine/threonine protein phosphatase 1